MVGPFPEDVLREEILLKLPAKPLLRFKLVCKGWHSIISNPTFVTKHFNRDTDLNQDLVIYCSGCSRQTRSMYTSYSCFRGADATVARHQVPDQFLLWGEITFLRGPCNGIFCIHSAKNRFALWNPTTRRLRPIYCSPSFKFDEMGFGVDPLTGDFKIVLIYCGFTVSSSFAVYTSRNHSWKYVEQESLCDSKSRVPTDNSYSNTFLNGYYYWLKHNVRGHSFSILAFDMHNEIFEEIKAPDIQLGIQLMDWKIPGELHLLNDSLSFVVTDRDIDGTYVYIWLMEEKGEWAFSLSLLIPIPIGVIRVYGFWGRNKILLNVYIEEEEFIPELITCDLANLDSLFLKVLDIKNSTTDSFGELIIMHYKESLFAVNGENGIGDYDARCPESLELLGYQGPFTKIGCLRFQLEANRGNKDCGEYYRDTWDSDEEVGMPRDLGNQYLVAESEKVDFGDPNE